MGRSEMSSRVIPGFWHMMLSAEHRLLALDYDGTLAPFRKERMEARPLAGVLEALEAIRDDPSTALYIISGRPAREVSELLEGMPVPIVGSHGYDYLSPDGESKVYPLTDRQEYLFDQAEEAARKSGMANHLERKAAGTALHTRGLDYREAKALEGKAYQIWEPLAEKGTMELREFNGGLELRAVGRDKGTVLVSIHKLMPDGTMAVYVGDDETDEDAFKAVRHVGIGIKVGGRGGETEAMYRLRDCGEVLEFLTAWAELAKEK